MPQYQKTKLYQGKANCMNRIPIDVETVSHEYGFKIKINKIEGKAMLCQNHSL